MRGLLVLAAAALLAACGGPRSRENTLGLEVQALGDSRLVLPREFDSSKPWRAVVLLPYTTGTASELFFQQYARQYAQLEGEGSFLVVLPPDRGAFGDYASAQAWQRTIERYEDRVADATAALSSRYRIDAVALGGHSLGGDLSWALALRHPERYTGAVVMGSRCSYRQPGSEAGLSMSAFRFVLMTGTDDLPVRVQGIRAASHWLTEALVPHHFVELPSLGHNPARAPDFLRATQFALRYTDGWSAAEGG